MSEKAGIPLEQEFFERCAAQQTWYRGPEGPYTNILGDYSCQAFANNDTSAISVDDFLMRRIEESIHFLPEITVALDVGGGVGVTWLRLARLFKNEIVAGRLKLIVTSLRGGPADYLREAIHSALQSSDESYKAQVVTAVELYDSHANDVTYLNAGFFPQEELTIGDNHRRYPLDGLTQIVHERHAITGWNRVPERTIVRLGKLISLTGLYMVSAEDTQGGFGRKDSYDPTPSQELATKERTMHARGVQAAHGVLTERLGLSAATHIECGESQGMPLAYKVFKGGCTWPLAFG